MASSDLHHDFATTHWSLIAVVGETSSSESRDALASLCETYWYPLYAFVLRKGYQTLLFLSVFRARHERSPD